MANNNKSTTKKKQNTGKSKKQQEIVENADYSAEIIIWIFTACMLIVELGNFGLCGIIDYISEFLFGLFGVVEYILPVALIVAAFFLHVNDYKGRAIQKVILAALLLLCVGVMAQLTMGGIDKFDIGKLYKASSGDHAGGGVICGSLAFLLNKGVGLVGTYIIMILAILVCVVFFAEISVIDLIRSVVFVERDEDDDRQLEMEDYNPSVRQRKKKRNYDRVVEEDYPQDTGKKPKKSMLEQISVLPAQTDKGILMDTNIANAKTEEVHEITMDYEVSLLGESMPEVKTSKEEKAKRQRKKPVVPKVQEVPPDKPKSAGGDASVSSSIENKTASPTEQFVVKDDVKTDGDYKFPPRSLLNESKAKGATQEQSIRENAQRLQEVLESFGVRVTMQSYSCGPSVTRFEMVPEQGVKVSKITGLADDLMMNLAAQSIRIEAPIPGKHAVGIEIPNESRSGVGFRELIDTSAFDNHKSKIAFAVGKDVEGNVIVEDIAKMPHLLIAGATGSGKSVCTNTLIMSILYKARPDEVKLILIDPKQVELKVYNGIPHLLTPVVTDPKKAAGALNWAVVEMTKRYQLFSEVNVRNISGFNAKVKELEQSDQVENVHLKKMPQIVIIVDELADLMMVAKAEVEEAIVRLAQLARAAGIHLVIATQRPSVDVVTGLIKANVPSRIALSVSSGVDSRTIIDQVGAEKLLGNGDMLFYPTNYPKPLRVQGAYISDEEVMAVVDFLKENNVVQKEDEEEDISKQFETTSVQSAGSSGESSDNGMDEYFEQAGKFIIEKNKASIGMLQRMYRIGFNRAARIMDQLHAAGVVGAEEGTKPRQVLMTLEEFAQYLGKSVDELM